MGYLMLSCLCVANLRSISSMGNCGTSYGAEISLGVALLLFRWAVKMSWNPPSVAGDNRFRLKNGEVSANVGLSLPKKERWANHNEPSRRVCLNSNSCVCSNANVNLPRVPASLEIMKKVVELRPISGNSVKIAIKN